MWTHLRLNLHIILHRIDREREGARDKRTALIAIIFNYTVPNVTGRGPLTYCVYLKHKAGVYN